MLRIAMKGIVFVGIWVLLLASLVAASESVAPIYERMKTRRALLQKHANEIHTLSLGTSHAQAIDFRELGTNGFHFWQGGADLHEASFLAREVVPTLPALQCVFISMSPYALHGDNGVPTSENRVSIRRELYSATSSKNFIEGDRNVFIAGKLAPLLRDDHWKNVVLALGGRRSERILENGAIERLNPGRTMSTDSLERDAVRTARRHEATIQEVFRAKPSAEYGGKRALDALFASSALKGLTIVLYTAPLHTSYIRAIPAVRLQEPRAVGAELSRSFENVVYADFSDAALFSGRADLFRDSNHLNEAGARLFSRMLAGRLRNDPRGAQCVKLPFSPATESR